MWKYYITMWYNIPTETKNIDKNITRAYCVGKGEKDETCIDETSGI